MPLAIAAGLASAFCWTLYNRRLGQVSTSLSACHVNLLQCILAMTLVMPFALLHGPPIPGLAVVLLVGSGALGIGIGDACFLGALRRVGVKQTLALQSATPLAAAWFSSALLAEDMDPHSWLGIGLIGTAAVIVVFARLPEFSEKRTTSSLTKYSIAAGVLLLITGMASEAMGALMARAAMQMVASQPLQGAALRLIGACLILVVFLAQQPVDKTHLVNFQPNLVIHQEWKYFSNIVVRWLLGSVPVLHHYPIRLLPQKTPRMAWRGLLLTTILGPVLGLSLQQLAYRNLSSGLVLALLATSPIMAIALDHLEGQSMNIAEWGAIVLTIIGTILLTRPGG